jgi:GntR family transcriptional regulator
MTTTVPKAAPDSFDRRSLHERIAADLRDDIMSGELPPGARLPSTTQLTSRFDASNATVQKALQLLKDEHLVVGRAGAAVTVREHRQRTLRPAASLAPAGTGGAPPLAQRGRTPRHTRPQRDPRRRGEPPARRRP